MISQKSVAGTTNYSYTYNANKQKLTESDGTMSSLSQTFSYDFENRLTSWTSNGTTLNQTQSWSLSLEGAWNSTTVNGNIENRTFNQTYEILFSNSNPMSHDRKGNLTTNKDGSVYTWDFDNQLTFSTAGTPSVNASYTYDAFGRRVSKSSNNTITIFVNSGYQILTEYASINNAPFAETQSFVYAAYIDDPIALISTNGTYFYHSNRQFSVGAITDSNGNISERYGYNAYGKPVVITDSILVDNPYFFTGRQLDSETGLFYFRARYYDASLGQFISRDPIGYVDGLSLYRGYFAPKSLDPFGREDMPPAELPKEEFHIEDPPKEVPEPPKKTAPPSDELWFKDLDEWEEARRKRERKRKEKERKEREKREEERKREREVPGGFSFELSFIYMSQIEDIGIVVELQDMGGVVIRAINDPCE